MHPPPGRNHIGVPVRCELLSDFVYSFFEHNSLRKILVNSAVVNCFQILYIRSLNTIFANDIGNAYSCELLSDFVYSFFEHNSRRLRTLRAQVVNCFQILYIRSLNTIDPSKSHEPPCCELLSDFVYSFFEHNTAETILAPTTVVNCFQILYIRSLNTIMVRKCPLLLML